jgi:MoxR-like ATPase
LRAAHAKAQPPLRPAQHEDDMLEEGKLYVGTSRNPDDSINKGEYLDLKYANRHGLVTGATGTGKTVTLQILAESFSNAGVPVFCADVKGDLSGIAAIGEYKDFLEKRAKTIGLAPTSSRNFRSSSGTCSARRATASAPRSRRWGRCCWRG